MRPFIVILLFFTLFRTNAQENKYVIKDNRRSEKVNFELFNNLIILPVMVNGVELKFLLDTGVEKTILFSFEEVDTLMLKNTNLIRIKGLSSKDEYSAYRSTGNRVKINDVLNENADVYVVFDKENYLTSSIGTVINGVIGYDLLKDLILRFNYQSQNIKFYTPEKFNRPLVLFKESSIRLINNKPHIKGSFHDDELGQKKGNFLLDTGSSDALWLYQKKDTQIPEKKFKDNLGFGFRGIISGYRSKINKFELAGYEFNEPNIAFPELNDRSFQQRVGSIGNEILRRFRIFISYPDRKIFFNSNSTLDRNFNYDKSGLLLRYDGVSIIEKHIPVKVSVQKTADKDYGSGDSKTNFKTIYEMKKKVKVVNVREGSPAEKSGILPDDIIVKLQGKSIDRYDLEEVRNLMSGDDGKQINLKINRNGKIIKIQFELIDRLN